MKSETKSLSVGGGLAPPERFKHLGDILRWYRFTLIPDVENQISIIGASSINADIRLAFGLMREAMPAIAGSNQAISKDV